MSDTADRSLPDAARHLGVSARVLRTAIRNGRIPGPAPLTATTGFSAEWLATTQATLEASPHLLRGAIPQKVPPFARYHGTSAWRKYSHRVREYANFLAAVA